MFMSPNIEIGIDVSKLGDITNPCVHQMLAILTTTLTARSGLGLETQQTWLDIVQILMELSLGVTPSFHLLI